MKVAIMQPYLFPYIGYFQLIAVVDRFVVHDDVQWIKGGWINRNRVLFGGESHYITLPVQKAASSVNINQRQLAIDVEKHKSKIVRQLESAYRNAPHLEAVLSLVSRCFSVHERNASTFVTNSLKECCTYLDISTPFLLSSELEKNNDLTGEDRVLDILTAIGGREYFNPIGGMDLYDKRRFAAAGLTLRFLKARPTRYRQIAGRDFVPSLSIIDVMMCNSKHELTNLLREYDLY